MPGEGKYPSFADPVAPVVTSAGAAAPITQVMVTPGIRLCDEHRILRQPASDRNSQPPRRRRVVDGRHWARIPSI
ncbi:MAG: hypothetical protein WB608_21705, partial [Terracidiphilus sp.]